ncbi:MAG: LPS translocon maturation chaperone LptM [Steroidobacteraceae bacterium]
MSTRTLIAAAAVLFGCTACGFKGPLYLPQQNGTVVTGPGSGAAAAPPAAQRPAAARKSEQKKTGGNGAAPP